MANEIISSYDFEEDAMGLGDWIAGLFNDKSISDEEMVVYVSDEQARPATSARFERETLTDGSTVVNLIISFDRKYDR
jgi:hypothetical protein